MQTLIYKQINTLPDEKYRNNNRIKNGANNIILGVK